jgi:hypothetical protein
MGFLSIKLMLFLCRQRQSQSPELMQRRLHPELYRLRNRRERVRSPVVRLAVK